jgi:hypothetical protein
MDQTRIASVSLDEMYAFPLYTIKLHSYDGQYANFVAEYGVEDENGEVVPLIARIVVTMTLQGFWGEVYAWDEEVRVMKEPYRVRVRFGLQS